MYRLLDEVLLEWLKTIQPVKNVVYATPEKAFSKGYLNQNNKILLPSVSFFRVSTSRSELRWNYPTSRAMAYCYIEKDIERMYQRNVGVIPVDVFYQVDIWAKYQDDLQNIWYQITKVFNPELRLKGVFNINNNQVEIPLNCYLENIADNSDLEPDEELDRILRSIANIKVESYVISEVKEWKLIRIITTDFRVL